MDNINGILLVWETQGDNALLGSLMPQIVQNQNFESLPQNNSPYESPFGEDSLFAEKKGQYYNGPVDFIKVLQYLGAPMPEVVSDPDQSGIDMFILMKELALGSGKIQKKPFNYVEYSQPDNYRQGAWQYQGIDFFGYMSLNMVVGYLQSDEIYLDKGSNSALGRQYALYIPYSSGSRSLQYVKDNAAIRIHNLEIDGLLVILKNLKGILKDGFHERIYSAVATDIQNLLESGKYNPLFLDNLTADVIRFFSTEFINKLFISILVGPLRDKDEILLLKLMRSLYQRNDFNPTGFLQSLLDRRSGGYRPFELLYEKMNDWGGDNNFSQLIIELSIIWRLSNFSDPENAIYKKKGYSPPAPIPYQQKIILGFRYDELDMEFDKDLNIKIEGYHNVELFDLDTWERAMGEPKIELLHHPFQPMTVFQRSDANEELTLGSGAWVPAFYLKAFDDKGAWENFEKSAWLALDVAVAYSGIGNLAKLRYLIKAANVSKKLIYLRTAYNVIQVSASTLSIGLSLVEDNENREWVNKIRSYLFWVEICTLAADLSTTKILASEAAQARIVLDEYRNTVRNSKKLREIDEFGAHLDEVADAERKLINTWDNGKLLSERVLRKRTSTLLQKYKNFKLEVHFVDEASDPKRITDWDARNVLGSFYMGPPPKLYFRKQVTELTWQHEIWHLEDLQKTGSKRFYNMPNWKKEELVWERVWKDKHKWTEEELADSYRYYKETALREAGTYDPVKEMEELLNKPYYKYSRYKK